MIVLGIETATQQVGCALGGVEGLLGSFHAAHGRRHTETLAPAIEFVCASVGIALDRVSVVAVDIGPGLFTGLRVGVATAKAIAQALRVPMIGLSSLDLLAHQARFSQALIVPVIDARRGEVFSAVYRRVPGGIERIRDYEVGSASDLAADIDDQGSDALLVGDGALRYREVFERVRGVEFGGPGTAYPSATDLVELAHPRVLREEFVSVGEISAMYLRKSDAEINWASRVG